MQADLFEAYKVDLEAFEGPLDLLLHLIRKEEVDIYNIPIHRITDQYLQHLSLMRRLDISIAGEFVLMAATLMMIKSRMLLPVAPVDDDNEDDWIDPRLDLVRQLIEYRKFKDAAGNLARKELFQSETFTVGGSRDTVTPGLLAGENTLLDEIGIDQLMEAFRTVLERTPSMTFGHLEPIRWSVPEKINHLLGRLRQTPRFTFESIFTPDAPRGEIIVTFTALLELLRLRYLTAIQETPFTPITLQAIPEGQPDSHLPLPAFDSPPRETTAG